MLPPQQKTKPKHRPKSYTWGTSHTKIQSWLNVHATAISLFPLINSLLVWYDNIYIFCFESMRQMAKMYISKVSMQTCPLLHCLISILNLEYLLILCDFHAVRDNIYAGALFSRRWRTNPRFRCFFACRNAQTLYWVRKRMKWPLLSRVHLRSREGWRRSHLHRLTKRYRTHRKNTLCVIYVV